MSAPVRLCPYCGERWNDHETVTIGGMVAARVCNKAPKDHLQACQPIYAWPLGGGKWQVRT